MEVGDPKVGGVIRLGLGYVNMIGGVTCLTFPHLSGSPTFFNIV